jgi:hypothetical protein
VTPYFPWHDLCPFSLLFTFEYFLDRLKNQGVGSLNCSVGLWGYTDEKETFVLTW